MENATSQFDWNSWLCSIPGIPAGWGENPAGAAPVAVVAMQAGASDGTATQDEVLPELKAA